MSIPLRIFDRNQGEKQRTQIDIDRSQQLTEATRAQVFSDVDSAYAQVESNIALLKPYKAKYKDQATRVRDTVTYAYQHGGASLMDFLNAQSDYRTVQLAYTATDRLLSDGRRTTESCRRTRGDPMISALSSQTAPEHFPGLHSGGAAMSRSLRLQRQAQQGDGAPPPAKVIEVPDMNLITIDNNDVSKFPLAAAEKVESADQIERHRRRLPRRLARGSGHLAGQWPRGRYQGPPR